MQGLPSSTLLKSETLEPLTWIRVHPSHCCEHTRFRCYVQPLFQISKMHAQFFFLHTKKLVLHTKKILFVLQKIAFVLQKIAFVLQKIVISTFSHTLGILLSFWHIFSYFRHTSQLLAHFLILSHTSSAFSTLCRFEQIRKTILLLS